MSSTKDAGTRKGAVLRYSAAARKDPLLRNGHLLTVSSLLTSALGAGYWALATRWYGDGTVGRNYSAVSAMMLLAGLGQLNLANVMVRFIPTAGNGRRSLIHGAYIAAFFATLVSALGFVLVVPYVSPGLSFLHEPGPGACFVAATVGFSLFALQDGVLTGLRIPAWAIWKNGAFSILKIVFVGGFALVFASLGIMLSWMVSLIAVLVTVDVLLAVKVLNKKVPFDLDAAEPPTVRSLLRFTAWDYVGSLCWMSAVTLPPIIVLDRVGDEAAAYFSLAWVVSYTLYLVAMNMGSSLLVETSSAPDKLAERCRKVLRHSGRLIVAAAAALGLAAPLVLWVFGRGYAEHGTVLLQLLAASAVPTLLIMTALSAARAQGRMGLVVTVQAVIAAAVLGLTPALLDLWGIAGAGAAWLITQSAVALVLWIFRFGLWLPRRDGSGRCGGSTGGAESMTIEVLGPIGPIGPGRMSPRTAAEALAGLGTLTIPVQSDRETVPIPVLASLKAEVPHVESAPVLTGTTTRPTVSVVICAYTMDRWEDIGLAVNSVLPQLNPGDEIILVTDHCHELAVRAEKEFTAVQVVRSRGKRGVCGARNTGVETASGEIVAFLDDDAAAEPGWLDALLSHYADPTVTGVGGRILPRWDDPPPAWWPEEFLWVVGATYRGVPEQTAPVRNGICANMSLRRRVILDAGGFSDDMGRIGNRPTGCDETELCIRVAKRNPGTVILYEPSALVRHHVPPGRNNAKYFRARCFAEGISKAVVSRIAGTDKALSSETSYITKTIPRGLLRALGPGGPPPSTFVALLVGVLWTGWGYLYGRVLGVANHDGEGTKHSFAKRLSLAGAMLPLPVAVVLWAFAVRGMDTSEMDDLGLVSLLPPSYWAALGLLTVGFTLSVLRRAATPWYLSYVLALIMMIHATPAILYDNLRYAWAWKHVDVIDQMLRHGGTLPSDQAGELAAYHQWPGFFTLAATLQKAVGLENMLTVAQWAPLFFNVMLIAPLLLLYRRFTGNKRLQWTGIWLFFSASWVGQDYFSPQAFVYFLYITALALLLKRGPAKSGWRRGIIAFVLGAAIVSSHQLTPILTVTASASLFFLKKHRRTAVWCVLVTAAMVLAWNLTVAREFVWSQVDETLKQLGDPGANAEAGFVTMGSASPGQALVAQMDRLLSAAVVLLAVIGFLRWKWVRRTPAGWLSIASVPLLAGGAYGGEIIFRVYLFALPTAAFLAACGLSALWLPRPRGRTPGFLRPVAVRAVALPVVLVLLLAGLVYGYYGKENQYRFTDDEVASVDRMHRDVPHNSLIVTLTNNFPAAYAGSESYFTRWFAMEDKKLQEDVLADPVKALTGLMATYPKVDAYLFMTRTQQTETEETGLLPRGTFDRIDRDTAASPKFTQVFRSRDAVLYHLDPQLQGIGVEDPVDADPVPLPPVNPGTAGGSGPVVPGLPAVPGVPGYVGAPAGPVVPGLPRVPGVPGVENPTGGS